MSNFELTHSAEKEIDHILNYTISNFGTEQMLAYKDQLKACIKTISASKGIFKTIERKGKTIRSLKCQRHYIFALERASKPILIIAVLHEKMDLLRHLGSRL